MKTVSGIGWRLLCSRPFALLWSSQAVAQIGDGVIKVALLWFVYTLTGSALKMTVIGLLQTIPPLVLGPLIGVYLDRMRKKPVMIWADLARAPLIATIPVLQALDLLTLPWLYLLVFLIAVAATIFAPAMVATVPVIVNRSELTAANALIQSTATIGVLVGPAISGPGIALIGAHNILYFGAVAFILSRLLLVPVRAANGSPAPRTWRTGGRASGISEPACVWSFCIIVSSVCRSSRPACTVLPQAPSSFCSRSIPRKSCWPDRSSWDGSGACTAPAC